MDTIETLALQAINTENPREIRNLLGQFATGVTVITTRGKDGRKIGMTATSFNVSFCLKRVHNFIELCHKWF